MSETPNDGWLRLLHSWSEELLSATNRIHNLIGNRHQPTKGGYLEALLRRLLRRVLPDRFRVSTGFIYHWDEQPSRQLDVVIWDAQRYSALLEEGELAILSAESVAAIIEVKSKLNRAELSDALTLLSPQWWVNWRYTSETSRTGLVQQVPDVPFRGVFAFTSNFGRVGTTQGVFSTLAEFYRSQFGEDAKNAMEHSEELRWINMVDAICVADGLSLEQTHVMAECENGSYQAPGFAAYGSHPAGVNVSVGRFCMYLLRSLTGWSRAEAARMTLDSAAGVEIPGVCCFGCFPARPNRLRLLGSEVSPESLWCPDPPLWDVPIVQEQ
jgi:hypothetical protein